MPTNNFKYMEDGFLVLNPTGGTSSGRVILRLTDISLSIENDTDETITFDNNWSKVYNQTFTNWSVSCSGVVSDDDGASEFVSTSSGDSAISGTYNGLQLISVAKDRSTRKHIILRLDENHYEKGEVVVASMEISASAGEKLVYSLELTGSGTLTTATS